MVKLWGAINDLGVHTYCLRCRKETVSERRIAGLAAYQCSHCGYTSPRALIIDPMIKWWIARDNEYWHAVSGVFVRDMQGRFLFFQRNKYPFGLTVPAGHIDDEEAPRRAAQRELYEETELKVALRALRPVCAENIRGDRCRRGSDAHRWYAYATRLPSSQAVVIDPHEGSQPQWLTLRQALRHKLTFVMRYIITRYGQEIISATS